MSWYGGYPPYVPVAERKRKAAHAAEKLKKKGQIMQPVNLTGRTIAKTFWGKAWCDNLESYSDYDNRLPRGRTYVRNGSVIDLNVAAGEINAMVSGSSIYKVKIIISSIVSNKWSELVKECAGKIDSLIELLQGKFSKGIMEIITRPEKGLFPHPKEIKLDCSCPDYADMCKHVAAVLYGVGARLDERPEDLFLLRKADHAELIAQAGKTTLTQTIATKGSQTLKNDDLSALFGIEMDSAEQINSKQDESPKKKLSLLKEKKKVSKSPTKKAVTVKATAKKIHKATTKKMPVKRKKVSVSTVLQKNKESTKKPKKSGASKPKKVSSTKKITIKKLLKKNKKETISKRTRTVIKKVQPRKAKKA
jgi:uncharacterized Zn finger protein